jgi:hypothetical protein
MTYTQQDYLKIKRSWADKHTQTEVDASSLVRTFLDNKDWEYREQYLIEETGTYLDYLVKAPYEDGHIFFGIECKRLLGYATKATQFADYIEQAGAYAKHLKMPIFLGPYIEEFSPSDLYQGGTYLSPVSAAAIFGGRFNVGIMGYNNRYGIKIDIDNPCFVLRGSLFWHKDKFNSKRLNIVTTTGSKKVRIPLKIYKRKSYEKDRTERRDRRLVT